jgi:hypothetical protein
MENKINSELTQIIPGCFTETVPLSQPYAEIRACSPFDGIGIPFAFTCNRDGQSPISTESPAGK